MKSSVSIRVPTSSLNCLEASKQPSPQHPTCAEYRLWVHNFVAYKYINIYIFIYLFIYLIDRDIDR